MTLQCATLYDRCSMTCAWLSHLRTSTWVTTLLAMAAGNTGGSPTHLESLNFSTSSHMSGRNCVLWLNAFQEQALGLAGKVPAPHIRVPGLIPGSEEAPCQGRQQGRRQVLESLPHKWETCSLLPVAGFCLTQTQF